MTSPLRRVLISVSDKNGVVELAHALTQMNCEILSTGGTAALLKQHNIPHIEVSEYTEFAEILDGRVKTLHPKIHAGILARANQEDELVLGWSRSKERTSGLIEDWEVGIGCREFEKGSSGMTDDEGGLAQKTIAQGFDGEVSPGLW